MKKAKRERLRREAAEVERRSLLHTTWEAFASDVRVGARLLREDGTTLVEKVETPRRGGSFATWSLDPPSARVASPRPDIPGWR